MPLAWMRSCCYPVFGTKLFTDCSHEMSPEASRCASRGQPGRVRRVRDPNDHAPDLGPSIVAYGTRSTPTSKIETMLGCESAAIASAERCDDLVGAQPRAGLQPHRCSAFAVLNYPDRPCRPTEHARTTRARIGVSFMSHYFGRRGVHSSRSVAGAEGAAM